MKKKDLKYIEERLLSMRARAVKDLGHYDEALSKVAPGSEHETSAYSFHMADQGTDAMEREKAFLFASKEGRYLYHLDEALRRIYRSPKTFGVCEECGDKITFERLDALPHTRLCIRCKEREETGVSD
jgi:RNA polymerase-binding transcription factor